MKIKIIILIIMLLSLNANAQDIGYGGMPGAYLHAGIGARALGMGKAYTALAQDATAIYWNPAGFAQQDNFQVYLMHSQLFLDTNFDYLAFIAPTQQFGNIGLGVIALSSNKFEHRNSLNEELGSFNMLDMAIFLSWSKLIYGGIQFGINYKFVSKKIINTSGIGHGIDIGLSTQIFDKVNVAFMLTNALQPKVKLIENYDKHPMQVRFGVASTFLNNNLTISSDIANVIGWSSTYFNIGFEYKIKQKLALRSGLENGCFTIGVGIALNNYGLDYSSSTISDLGMNHRFAVNYNFGGFRANANATPQIFSPVGDMNITHINLQVKSRTPINKWSFEIIDENGQVIRKYINNGVVPEEIIWDGRDNVGSMASDGRFDYNFQVYTEDGKCMYAVGKLVTIDTEGPDGTLGFK